MYTFDEFLNTENCESIFSPIEEENSSSKEYVVKYIES